MLTVVSSIQLPKVVQLYPALARRTDFTRAGLGERVLQGRSSLPPLTPFMHAVSLVMAQAYSGAPIVSTTPTSPSWNDQPLMTAITNVSRFYLQIAKGIERLYMQQKIRFIQNIMDRSQLAEMTLQNLGLGTATIPVTPEGLIDIMTNSLGAGPLGSEHISARFATAALRVTPPPTSVSGFDLNAAGLEELVAYLRMLELLTYEFIHPPAVADDFTRLSVEQFVQETTRALRSIACTLTSINLVACTTCLGHVKAVASHPWMAHTLYGKSVKQYQDAIAHLASRQYDTSNFAPWPEMAADTMWDSSIIRPWMFSTDPSKPGASASPAQMEWKVPPRMTKLPASVSEYALFNELLTPVRFKDNFGLTLVDQLWEYIGHADQFQILLDDIKDSGTTGSIVPQMATAVVVPPVTLQQTRTMTYVAETTGYPIVSDFDPRNPGPASSRTFVQTGLMRFSYYTLAELTSLAETAFKWQPIFVGKASSSEGLPVEKVILPAIAPYDTEAPFLAFNRDNLCRLWGTHPADLERELKDTPANPNSMRLRGIAQALRFVGSLEIHEYDGQSVTPGQTEDAEAVAPGQARTVKAVPVQPYGGHLYHAACSVWVNGNERFTDMFGEYILLGALGATGGTTLVLRPFKAVPTSASTQRMFTHLAEIDRYRVRPSAALVRWHALSARDIEPGLPILGWRAAADAGPADIVMMPLTSCLSAGYVELQGNDDVSPVLALRPNAIVSILEDTPSETYQPLTLRGVIEAEEMLPT